VGECMWCEFLCICGVTSFSVLEIESCVVEKRKRTNAHIVLASPMRLKKVIWFFANIQNENQVIAQTRNREWVCLLKRNFASVFFVDL
jgi:hypothetical protein